MLPIPLTHVVDLPLAFVASGLDWLRSACGLGSGSGPTAPGGSWTSSWDWFTNYGAYQSRIHCMTTPEGGVDWPWAIALIALSAAVVAGYLRIFRFWRASYLSEAPDDRNGKLMDLAHMFVLCAISGYAMSIVLFAWPAYRLLALLLLALNIFTWRFIRNLDGLRISFGARRLERELEESLRIREQELESVVIARTAELQHVRSALESSVDSFFIIEAVRDGSGRIIDFEVLDATARAASLMCVTRPELIGTRVSSRCCGALAGPMIEWAAKAIEAQQPMERVEPVGLPGLCAAWMRQQAVPTGEILVLITRDVTEEHRAKVRALRLQAQLSEIIDHGPAEAWVKDLEGRYILVSHGGLARMGKPAEEVLGVTDAELIPQEFAQRSREVDERVIRTGEPVHFEELVQERGQERCLLTTRFPLREGTDRVRAVASVSLDISESRRAQEGLRQYADELLAAKLSLEFQAEQLEKARAQAEAAARSKSEFLAHMSHEIRTPMTAILGFTDMLAEPGSGEEAVRRRFSAIETIRRNGEHLLQIIGDILDISKIESGRMEVELIRCEPLALADELIKLLGPRASAKDLTLHVETPRPIPRWIRTDPTRLRQILVNLVGNAIKFTSVGGVILRLGFENDGASTPRLVVDVVDSGMGMSSEQAGRLFTPFTQADTSMSRRFGGTGLGLAISKRLAVMLGGDLTVVSEPGKGSTFTLRVSADPASMDELVEYRPPLATAPGPAAGPAADTSRNPSHPDPSKQTRLDGVSILLVEDGVDNCRLISHILRKAGATLESAANGLEGIERYDAARSCDTPFDLILMDMQMPVMDGYEATATLRRLGATLPIIALTAHAMSGDREKCLSVGCNEYATKPVNPRVLVELCASLVRQRREPRAAA